MFTVNGIVINANLNESVIHGTMRNQDLIPVFLEVIKNTPEYKKMMNLVHMTDGLSVIEDKDADENDPRWDNDEVSMFLNDEVFDALAIYSPFGYCFGSDFGDGSDYGFWFDYYNGYDAQDIAEYIVSAAKEDVPIVEAVSYAQEFWMTCDTPEENMKRFEEWYKESNNL